MLLEHMKKKFEIHRAKTKGGCQSGRKVVTHNSKSDLPLDMQVETFCLSINRWHPRLQSKFFPFKLVHLLSKKEGFCRIFCAGMNCQLKRLHMSFGKANSDSP